jgi:MoaA/NifB/PqqE/SkfB family radical SAM enzyme
MLGFSLHSRRQRAWRTHLRSWIAAEVLPLLQSSQGDARLRTAGEELARRLSRPLSMLNRGAATLDNPKFATALNYVSNWLAGQEDVLLAGETLRAFCDVSTSLAALERITAAIARELELNAVDVQRRIAAAAPAWREPLILAGRARLAEGRYDDAIALARRAAGLMSACPDASRLLVDALRARRDAGEEVHAPDANVLTDLRGRFCSRPFEVLVSTQTNRWSAATQSIEQVMGESYLCDCVAWLPHSIGNVISAESPDAIWNSAGAQEIRRSILDGDFRYCSRTLCPAIVNDALPKREEVEAPRLRAIIDDNQTVLADPPRLLSLGHDASCNLACPTCRPAILMADREQNERLDRARDRVILPMLRGSHSTGLRLTAWGDPFASRHYRSIIEALRGDEYRGVRLFLLTNGLLLTRKQWAAMPHLADRVVALSVSVDAATKETYEDVRRPGRWEVIEENLRFFGELRRAGNFVLDDSGRDAGDQGTGFGINFVVQIANFREMPAFARLGQEIGADYVGFQKYISFGHEGTSYSDKDIASPSHARHAEFLEVLKHPNMRDPRVMLMQLEGLKSEASAPEHQ